jgi:hypothetical protein
MMMMKTNRTYRMGYAALTLVLILAACTNIFRPEANSSEIVLEGMGTARIRLNAGESVRTVVPAMGTYYFTLDFTAPKKAAVNKALNGGANLTLTVVLEPAVWTLEVKGYADSAKTDLKVSGRASVPITAGIVSSFDVYLAPDFSSGGTGGLDYSISFPATARGTFGLYPIDDTLGTSREIAVSDVGGTASGTLWLSQGSYRAVIDLYDGAANTAAVWSGVTHIYNGSTTPLAHTFTAVSFAVCDPVVGVSETTLAAKLDTALASPSGAYTIVLDGMETDLPAFVSKDLTVTANKNITVTIRGNGKTVQLGDTNNGLFTLGAASGNLKLILQDVTLRGRSGAWNSPVQVNNGGTLEMKAGSRITGNTSSSNGGGVSVFGGTFNMNGGAISGNSTSYDGGGVYVSSGTFSMSGGAVSGNFASSDSGSSYGGGVYIDSGTFSMSGGAVNSNSASDSSYSSYGGGVYIGSGTFSMSGGVVSGNSATAYTSYSGTSSYGGGVYVGSGTFSMSGGAVSGNTSSAGSSSSSFANSGSFSYGGGVYVGSGIFSMSGGAVSSNTSRTTADSYRTSSLSYGGGVYVDSGAFNLSGGVVGSNTSSSSHVPSDSNFAMSYGGGVAVWDGAFNMSGGAVSGNTSRTTANSSSYSVSALSSMGGGVYVFRGTFCMDGGAVSGNTSSSSFSVSEGGGVYTAGGGTFTKQQGSIIYGSNESDSSLRNTAGIGHAAYANGLRNTTAGGDITLDSRLHGSAGGWESEPPPPLPSSGIRDISYSFVSGGAWTLESDGRHKSPAIDHGNVTKVRVSFTSIAANAGITIALDVSSETGYDYAFIGALDNASATYDSGYYIGSRISGLTSVTVTIPVPTSGSHFIDICYRKDGSESGGLDCAWFKISEPIPFSNGISGISYSSVSGGAWVLESDGRRRSPTIGHSSLTKMRVSFTSDEANANIAIVLDVSSEEDYDYAFIGALDNASATYDSGYYTGSRISGTASVTITIPVPTLGAHFIDICYQKDGSETGGSDRAWFKVNE